MQIEVTSSKECLSASVLELKGVGDKIEKKETDHIKR